MSDIVDALKAEANRLDRRAYADRCVGPDCALSSLVAATAAAEIERLRVENVALRQSALQHVKEANRHQARLAEAVEVVRDVTPALIAAISLLERGGKKAAASDKMFAQMLADYSASVERARDLLAKLEGR